ncbi:hypothetical protein [Desulfoplanes sp.]
MNPLENVSLYVLSDVLRRMECLYEEDPQTYQDFLGEICDEFPLAREYMLAIQHMSDQGADGTAIKQADLNMRHIMALWIITMEKHIPGTAGMADH